jgi:hypothetical protein
MTDEVAIVRGRRRPRVAAAWLRFEAMVVVE